MKKLSTKKSSSSSLSYEIKNSENAQQTAYYRFLSSSNTIQGQLNTATRTQNHPLAANLLSQLATNNSTFTKTFNTLQARKQELQNQLQSQDIQQTLLTNEIHDVTIHLTTNSKSPKKKSLFARLLDKLKMLRNRKQLLKDEISSSQNLHDEQIIKLTALNRTLHTRLLQAQSDKNTPLVQQLDSEIATVAAEQNSLISDFTVQHHSLYAALQREEADEEQLHTELAAAENEISDSSSSIKFEGVLPPCQPQLQVTFPAPSSSSSSSSSSLLSKMLAHLKVRKVRSNNHKKELKKAQEKHNLQLLRMAAINNDLQKKLTVAKNNKNRDLSMSIEQEALAASRNLAQQTLIWEQQKRRLVSALKEEEEVSDRIFGPTIARHDTTANPI